MAPALPMHVLLLETSASHEEVLLSWCLTLGELGVEHISIACTTAMKARLQDAVGYMRNLRWLELPADTSLLQHLRIVLRIARRVRRNACTHVVANTLAGALVRDIVMALPRRCTVIGVVHYVQQLRHSSNFRLMRRHVDAVAVLSPHLAELAGESGAIAANPPLHVVPASAYMKPAAIVRPEGEVWVAIPGSIERGRKDIDMILDPAFVQALPANVRLVVLGNASGDAPERTAFRERAAAAGKSVVWFNRYVPIAEYGAWLQACSVVLPLIHPQCHEYSEFMTNKASGAFGLAWAFCKPLLLERGFARFRSLHRGVRFYDVNMLLHELQHLEWTQHHEAMHGLEASIIAPAMNDTYRLESTLRILSSPSTPYPVPQSSSKNS